jgi:hypothetical protein
MAYSPDKLNNTDEQIGAFSGYIKRPQPNMAGMIAQFFGENGEDADTISALSLTKFQDAQVYVSVRMIKDALGNVMKKDGQYPEIARFLAVIRRPMPSKNGMTAQFFAPNGKDSDAVNDLGKSFYQDCLVYIDVRGKLAAYNAENEPVEINQMIDLNYLNKVTDIQKKEYSKKEKSFKKLNEHLSFGFLRNLDVLAAVGNETDFKNWLLQNKSCVFPVEGASCPDEPIELFELNTPNSLDKYNYVPLCEHHHELISQDMNILPNGEKFLEMKHILLAQEWAWDYIKKNFSLTGNEEPDPEKIIEWAAQKGIGHLLPKQYKVL